MSLFKPLREAADGTSASCSFGLRRPGRSCCCLVVAVVGGDGREVVVDSGVAREEDDGAGGGGGTGGESLADGFDAPSSLVGVACAAVSSLPSGGFQSGHFFASAESSGTSSTSLSLRSNTLIREGGRNKDGKTHTTSSPANRCRFSILIIRLASLSTGGADGASALTESWNFAHNTRRSLRLSAQGNPRAHTETWTHLLAAARSSEAGSGELSTRGRLVSRSSSVSESGCKSL